VRKDCAAVLRQNRQTPGCQLDIPGVPVDNTVGTAQFTAEDFLNGINTSVNPIADRIKNSSTVQTTGAQLASYLS